MSSAMCKSNATPPPGRTNQDLTAALQMRQGHAWLVFMTETASYTWMSSLNIEVPSG